MKLLWWSVHEPLVADSIPHAAALARGTRVGLAARNHIPGGILIDAPAYSISDRLAATSAAIASGATVLYEASFATEDTFASVDILQRDREREGWVPIEVKATLEVKEHHLADVAFQVQCLRRAGLVVTRAEVMQLNRECRCPELMLGSAAGASHQHAVSDTCEGAAGARAETPCDAARPAR